MPNPHFDSFRTNFGADCSRAWPHATVTRLLWNICVDSGLRSTLYLRIQLLFQDLGLTPLARLMSRLNVKKHSLDVVVGAKIGPGLVIRHPAGIVIGCRSVIGSDATIMQNVTLGQRELSGELPDSGNPVLEDGVTIGCGAVVLGHVRIGAHATVGASSLVLTDVPAGSTAVGIPARMKSVRPKTAGPANNN